MLPDRVHEMVVAEQNSVHQKCSRAHCEQREIDSTAPTSHERRRRTTSADTGAEAMCTVRLTRRHRRRHEMRRHTTGANTDAAHGRRREEAARAKCVQCIAVEGEVNRRGAFDLTEGALLVARTALQAIKDKNGITLHKKPSTMYMSFDVERLVSIWRSSAAASTMWLRWKARSTNEAHSISWNASFSW